MGIFSLLMWTVVISCGESCNSCLLVWYFFHFWMHIYYTSVIVLLLPDYMYSGTLKLTEANIENVFLTADFLQIATVRERCLQRFPQFVSCANCTHVSNSYLVACSGSKHTDRTLQPLSPHSFIQPKRNHPWFYHDILYNKCNSQRFHAW